MRLIHLIAVAVTLHNLCFPIYLSGARASLQHRWVIAQAHRPTGRLLALLVRHEVDDGIIRRCATLRTASLGQTTAAGSGNHRDLHPQAYPKIRHIVLQAVTRCRNLPFYPALAKAARYHHSIHSAERCIGHCLGIDPLDRHLAAARPGGCFECLGDGKIGIGIINIFRDEANRQPLAVSLAVMPDELLPTRHIRYCHIASKARQHRA